MALETVRDLLEDASRLRIAPRGDDRRLGVDGTRRRLEFEFGGRRTFEWWESPLAGWEDLSVSHDRVVALGGGA